MIIMIKLVKKFEKIIVYLLIILMMITITFGMGDLFITFISNIIAPPYLRMSVETMLSLFGFLFMILIGLELLETIKSYITDDHINVEIVFLVAMIAVARKVILLETNQLEPFVLFGLGVIIIALTSGYYLIKKSQDSSNIISK